MTSLTNNRRVSRVAIGGLLAVGLVAGGALSSQAIGLDRSGPQDPTATVRPLEPTGVSPVDAFGNSAEPRLTRDAAPTPPLVSDLGVDIFLGDKAMPDDLVISPDGRYAYVTGSETALVYVVNLQTRTLESTIAIPAAGARDIAMNAAGTRAVVVMEGTPTTTLGVALIDLEKRTVIQTYLDLTDWANDIVMTADGSSFYTIGVNARVTRVDTTSGEILAQVTMPTNNATAAILTPDESRLIVGRTGQGLTGTVYAVLDPKTLDVILDAPKPDTWAYGGFDFDQNPGRMYLAESGTSVAILDPTTGDPLERVSVGSMMTDVIGDDALNRAYSPSLNWDMVMAADFNTGERSESYRATEVGATTIRKNPVTGDLVTANRGYWGDEGSTITLITKPAVTDPTDVVVDAVGEEISFSSAVTGVKRGNGGGVIWQSSPDGETWTDIEGALGNNLTVTVTAENFADSYRLRFNDDFWGIRGASAPAKAITTGPSITLEGDLPGGTVGGAYTPTIVTATGQPDLAWSLGDAVARATAGMPEGLELNPATGEITGTPTTAGEYIVSVTVTDAFGTDTRDFGLNVVASGAPTTPTDPGTTTPGTTTPGTGVPTADGNLARTGAELTWPALAGALALLLAGAYALRRGRTA
ncbi:putative Ig domain-containing protein [Mycetocola spongiae]|uniref:putative Ig domain-containing protein n=1 Tax=Mycetocola spongiae TaxID=2859226 RepID=UPI0021F48AA7|nr:putative Ig domain-containing protein [Mycetocola spongiae]UCR90244.1 putative Ig domain-containing protein [Mycetocola spongiae]